MQKLKLNKETLKSLGDQETPDINAGRLIKTVGGACTFMTCDFSKCEPYLCTWGR